MAIQSIPKLGEGLCRSDQSLVLLILEKCLSHMLERTGTAIADSNWPAHQNILVTSEFINHSCKEMALTLGLALGL